MSSADIDQTQCDASRRTSFSHEAIEEWCDDARDYNVLHSADPDFDGLPFDEQIVPGMMVMDQVSGVLYQLSKSYKDGAVPIISNIVSFRFREPVYPDEPVIITATVVDDEERFTSVEVRVSSAERDTLCADGMIKLVIE